MKRRTLLGLISAALSSATTGAQLVQAAESSGAGNRSALRPILVIGATARTGPEILSQGLSQGRRVSALARSPERIEIKDPKLRVFKGDVYDLDSLVPAMTGEETVISLIGPKVDMEGEGPGYVDLYSVGIATVIAAMRRQGNRRLIAVSSGGTEQIPSQAPSNGNPVDAFVWKERNLYGDMQRMEKIIAVSGLEWQVLRPRAFTIGPKLNNLKLAVHEHATDFEQYKSLGARTPAPSSRLTYADFAALVLSLTDEPRYLGDSVGVYTDVV